jgi:hypothetical protein
MKKYFTYERIILYVIALAMLNNVEHLAYVHHSIARGSFHLEWANKAHSIVVVLILEVIIVTLAHYGQRAFAGFYTLMLFCLQLIYYPLSDYLHNGETGKFMAAIIYSAMFTISIYYFSIMAAKQNGPSANKKQFAGELEQVNKHLQQSENFQEKKAKELEQTKRELEQTQNSLQEIKSDLQELRAFKELYVTVCTCPKCGQVFPSESSKRSHMGKCKGNL